MTSSRYRILCTRNTHQTGLPGSVFSSLFCFVQVPVVKNTSHTWSGNILATHEDYEKSLRPIFVLHGHTSHRELTFTFPSDCFPIGRHSRRNAGQCHKRSTQNGVSLR